jgi:hypothetical protein
MSRTLALAVLVWASIVRLSQASGFTGEGSGGNLGGVGSLGVGLMRMAPAGPQARLHASALRVAPCPGWPPLCNWGRGRSWRWAGEPGKLPERGFLQCECVSGSPLGEDRVKYRFPGIRAGVGQELCISAGAKSLDHTETSGLPKIRNKDL